MGDYVFRHIMYRELDDLASAHPVVHTSGKGPRRSHYQGCPTIHDDFPCFFYLTTPQGQLIASTRAFPDRLVTEDTVHAWAWTGDLFTEEAFRGQGLATALQRESTRWLHQRGIGRGIVFSREPSLRIYQKFGFTLLGYAPRYLLLKSAGPFLRAHLPSRALANALEVWSRPLLGALGRMGRVSGRVFSPGMPGLQRRRVALNPAAETLADRFARLWYPTSIHFDDSFATIRWKLEQAKANPENRCDLHWLQDRHGTPVGFFISRLKQVTQPLEGQYRDFCLLTLMRFGLFQNNVSLYAALLDQLITVFWQSPAEVLSVITNCAPLTAAARVRGMFRMGRGMSFTLAVPSDWPFVARDYELPRWPLTPFCGDGFRL